MYGISFKKLKFYYFRMTNIHCTTSFLSLFSKTYQFREKRWLHERSIKISIMNIILPKLPTHLYRNVDRNVFHSDISVHVEWYIKQILTKIPSIAMIETLPELTVVCFQVRPLFHGSRNSPPGNCITSRQVTSNQLRPNSFILCANLSFGCILKVTVS